MKKGFYKWFVDNVSILMMFCVLIFVGVGLFVNTGKSCDTNMDFIVVGNFSALNGTIPEMQFECISMCAERMRGQGYNYLELCYDQCTTIGSLGCDGCRGFVNEEELMVGKGD